MKNLKTVEVAQGKQEVAFTLDLTGIFAGITLNIRKRVYLNKGTDKEVQLSDETISESVNLNFQEATGIKDLSVLDLAKAINDGLEKAKASQAL